MQRKQSRLLTAHYLAVLGLRPGASPAKVKQAYRRLAKKYHPDLRPGDSAAEERFKKINEAYHFLLDNSVLLDHPGGDGGNSGAAAPHVDFGRHSPPTTWSRRWSRRWSRPWVAIGIPVLLCLMVMGFAVERATRPLTVRLADREGALLEAANNRLPVGSTIDQGLSFLVAEGFTDIDNQTAAIGRPAIFQFQPPTATPTVRKPPKRWTSQSRPEAEAPLAPKPIVPEPVVPNPIPGKRWISPAQPTGDAPIVSNPTDGARYFLASELSELSENGQCASSSVVVGTVAAGSRFATPGFRTSLVLCYGADGRLIQCQVKSYFIGQ